MPMSENRVRRVWLSVVDLSAVAKGDDDDQQSLVFDGVQHAVVSDSDAKPGASTQCSCPGRPRISGEKCYRTPYAGLVLVIDSFECASRRRSKFDAIGHRVSPAKISLDLLPWNVIPLFSHGCIKRGDVLDLLGGVHEPVILGGAEDDGLGLAATVNEDGLTLGCLDHGREGLTCL